MKLEQKIAIITGGSTGIGKSIAEVLAKEGAQVIICARNEDNLKGVCKAIISDNGKCEYYVVDVKEKKQIEKFLDDIITTYGRIDILVNSAGWTNKTKYIEDVTDEEYENIFKTNVDSIFYFVREILPVMKKQDSGIIINMSSGAGKKSNPILPIYSASKFALQGLTAAIGKEVKELNTNVSCVSICPAGVNTRMRDELFNDAESQQSPEVIANIVRDILTGKLNVPNGGSVSVKNGEITSIDRPE